MASLVGMEVAGAGEIDGNIVLGKRATLYDGLEGIGASGFAVGICAAGTTCAGVGCGGVMRRGCACFCSTFFGVVRPEGIRRAGKIRMKPKMVM